MTVCCSVSAAGCTSLFMAYVFFFLLYSQRHFRAACVHQDFSLYFSTSSSSARRPLCWRFCVWSRLPLWMCIMCLSLSCLSGCTHWVSVLSAWNQGSARGAGCSHAGRHFITASIKQLPRSLTALRVFPTTPAVISQIIGVTVGASRAEKRMCQTGHWFPAERSVPLHHRLKLCHFSGCEEVNAPPDQAFIFWRMSTCFSLRVSMLGGNPFKVLVPSRVAHVCEKFEGLFNLQL